MTRLIDLSTPVETGHFRWDVERRLIKSHASGAKFLLDQHSKD